jgi:hypothetical protein
VVDLQPNLRQHRIGRRFFGRHEHFKDSQGLGLRSQGSTSKKINKVENKDDRLRGTLSATNTARNNRAIIHVRHGGGRK